jgi:hypothetical protein
MFSKSENALAEMPSPLTNFHFPNSLSVDPRFYARTREGHPPDGDDAHDERLVERRLVARLDLRKPRPDQAAGASLKID